MSSCRRNSFSVYTWRPIHKFLQGVNFSIKMSYYTADSHQTSSVTPKIPVQEPPYNAKHSTPSPGVALLAIILQNICPLFLLLPTVALGPMYPLVFWGETKNVGIFRIKVVFCRDRARHVQSIHSKPNLYTVHFHNTFPSTPRCHHQAVCFLLFVLYL